MADFEVKGVAAALEDALKAADHLTPKHAGTVAAARALAAKIDAWDTIVEWALDDAVESGSRPRVPANDNTSLPTFLKFMEGLGLAVEKPAAGGARGKPVEASVEPEVPVPGGVDRESKARATLSVVGGKSAG